MTKENLIIDLRNYKENIAKLKLRRREKAKYEKRIRLHDKTIETSITGSLGMNCDIHSKNQISNKVEKAVLNAISKEDEEIENAKKRIKELEAEIEELEDKVTETSIRLSALKYKEKEILFAYYVEGRSYEDIGNNLHFRLFNQTRDSEAIKKIVEKATSKMLKL